MVNAHNVEKDYILGILVGRREGWTVIIKRLVLDDEVLEG